MPQAQKKLQRQLKSLKSGLRHRIAAGCSNHAGMPFDPAGGSCRATKPPGNLRHIAAHSGRIGIRRRTVVGADGIVAEVAGTAAAVAAGSFLGDHHRTGGTAAASSVAVVVVVVADIAAAAAAAVDTVVADVPPAASEPGLSRATPAACLNAVAVVVAAVVAAAAAAVEGDVLLASLGDHLTPPLDQFLLALHARFPPAASGGQVTVTGQIPSSSVLHRCCRYRLQNSCFLGEPS